MTNPFYTRTFSPIVGQIAKSASLKAEFSAIETAFDDVYDTDQWLCNVQTFGATGDGVTDDTAAIQAALSSGAKCVFLPVGNYLVSSPLVISTNALLLRGDGKSSRIIAATDIDIIRVNIGGRYAYFNQFYNFAMAYTGVSAPSSGACIRYYDSLGTQAGGGTHGIFHALWMDHKYGIVFDRAKLGTFAPSWPDVADYGHFAIKDCQVPYNAGRMAIAVWFKGGPGAHNTYSGNDFTASDACIRMGGSDDGVGDQIFVGNHLLDAAYAIDIIGPTTSGNYNQNITVCGNQFDGISTATVRMTRMQNFRIGPNNSTSSVGPSLVSCTGNYWSEDRGNIAYSGTFTTLAAISTSSSPIITDGSGWRWASPVIARRSTDDSYLAVAGGNIYGNGASIQLYGGSHATTASHAIIDANSFYVRTQSGSAKMFEVIPNASALGFYGATPVTKPAVTGSRGGNAALASLITKLASLGLVTDSTTA